MTRCDRCITDRLCLNHAAEAKSAAFIRDRNEREALVIIKARGLIPCVNRVHYTPGDPEGTTMPQPALHRDIVGRPLCNACLAFQEHVVEPMGAAFHIRANSYRRAA